MARRGGNVSLLSVHPGHLIVLYSHTMLLRWMDEELRLYLCHQGSHSFCFGSERGKQLKCLIAIFRAAFILKEEKSENIKIHRNDSKTIGNPYLRMNYAF